MQFQFDSFTDFIKMSGHGPYVWSCYALVVIALVYLCVVPLQRRKALFEQLRRQHRIAERTQKQSQELQ